jgi:hypothetical protein
MGGKGAIELFWRNFSPKPAVGDAEKGWLRRHYG